MGGGSRSAFLAVVDTITVVFLILGREQDRRFPAGLKGGAEPLLRTAQPSWNCRIEVRRDALGRILRRRRANMEYTMPNRELRSVPNLQRVCSIRSLPL